MTPSPYPALPAFEAVIFDMDGLVLDTEPTYIKAWQKAGQACGITLSDEFCHDLLGRHADDVRQALQQSLGSSCDLAHFFYLADARWREHIATHGIAIMVGLEGLLGALLACRIPYALATNSDRRYAMECLRVAGADSLFDIVVCRDDVAHGKPEPDLIVEAARRVSVPLHRCLVLEDSQTGLVAAARAGAMPILVKRDAVPPQLSRLAQAHYVSLADVADSITFDTSV